MISGDSFWFVLGIVMAFGIQICYDTVGSLLSLILEKGKKQDKDLRKVALKLFGGAIVLAVVIIIFFG